MLLHNHDPVGRHIPVYVIYGCTPPPPPGLLGLRIVTRYDVISYMGQASFHSLAARQ